MTDNKCPCKDCKVKRRYEAIVKKQREEIKFLKEKLIIFREHYSREDKYL